MTDGPRAVGAAPFLVGVVIAVVGVTGGGLLLVEGAGLLRAGVTVLAFQAGALAAGAWEVGSTPPALVRGALRARWIRAFVSLVAAVVVAGWWQMRGLPGDSLSRGVALGLLVGLPQLALGGITGLLGRERSVAAPLLAGAAAGLLLAGLLLVPRVSPAVVLAGCVALLSAGALLDASATGGGS